MDIQILSNSINSKFINMKYELCNSGTKMYDNIIISCNLMDVVSH